MSTDIARACLKLFDQLLSGSRYISTYAAMPSWQGHHWGPVRYLDNRTAGRALQLKHKEKDNMQTQVGRI